MRPTLAALAVLALALPIAAPASAQTTAESTKRLSEADRYAECMNLARSDPATAVERARTWADTGGDDPARHCEAVAMMSLGHYAQAGKMLETLAERMDKRYGADLRAHALMQAGRAWMLAGEPARGEAAVSQAIKLTPDDVELWIDRANARFQLGDYWKAIDDLNRAQELAPDRPDIYAYRGSAYRFVDSPTMARENIDRALKIDPDNPMALFESGVLHRMDGERDAARDAWMRVIEQDPDSPMADAARDNLERMDVSVEEDAGNG